MTRCINLKAGCLAETAHPKLVACADCYNAYVEGGPAAVLREIQSRNTAHSSCVGAALVAEKDAEIAKLQAEVAEYAAFKAEVVEMHTFRFRGEVRLPNEADLLPRLRMDYATATTARTVMSRSGNQPAAGTPMEERSQLTQKWLRALPARLAFAASCARNRDEKVLELEQKLADLLGGPEITCQPVSVRKHPTAQSTGVTKPSAEDNQLNRIESLVKQAAAGGPSGWPFAAFLLGAVIAYLIK